MLIHSGQRTGNQERSEMMRRSAASLSVMAIKCATGLLLFVATHRVWSAPPLTDTTISDAVEDELLVDKAVPLQNIDVTTIDGIVTLEGQVSNALAKERAARIAETVKGVRAVVNSIKVVPPVGKSDPQIAKDISQALSSNAATDAHELEVDEVANGVATLSGVVDSW